MAPASPAPTKRVRSAADRARHVIRETHEQLRLKSEPELPTGVIYNEDNIRRLALMPPETVDLVYLDPPFFSNRRYEVIWGDEAEVRSFEDRWSGGIEVYADWMRSRLVEIHRVLKPTGSLYLHCDPNASHYLKVVLDSIFGASRFRSEIVWKRSTAHSDTKQGRRQHGRIHDVIFFYTKSDEWTWNPQYTQYDDAYQEGMYKHVEPETGRRYGLFDLTGPGGASKGNPRYEVLGVTRYWRHTKASMEDLIREGRVVQTKPGAVPRYKRYLDEMPGVSLQDLWTDIRPVGAQARERLGYPTQKPEALLERIIETSSNQGDVVLDPFCGCGTTLVVAEQAHRQWIGIDISSTACNLMKRRLLKIGAHDVKVIGLPATEADLLALRPFEFQNWIIDRLNGIQANRKSGDMGIDGWTFFLRDPVQIKQSQSVGREVVDKFETAITRAGKTRGAIVALSFTKGAREEVARVRQTGLNIHLITVVDLLEQLDLVMIQLGVNDGAPSLREAPVPKYDASRRSAVELIASEKARRKSA